MHTDTAHTKHTTLTLVTARRRNHTDTTPPQSSADVQSGSLALTSTRPYFTRVLCELVLDLLAFDLELDFAPRLLPLFALPFMRGEIDRPLWRRRQAIKATVVAPTSTKPALKTPSDTPNSTRLRSMPKSCGTMGGGWRGGGHEGEGDTGGGGDGEGGDNGDGDGGGGGGGAGGGGLGISGGGRGGSGAGGG